MLAALTLPCQLPSPLLPSEIGAINTQGEFKESPPVFSSICKIITETSRFQQRQVAVLNKLTAIQRSELLQMKKLLDF